MKTLRAILVFAAFALAVSCSPEGKKTETEQPKDPNIRVVKEHYPDGKLKSSTEALGKLRHGESKEYRKDGTLESLITYQNNRKHGPSRSYYNDGKTVKTEILYADGFKHGEAKWFYPDGEIYRITPYEKGKIEGIRKTFYEGGTAQAEIPYSGGQPGTGLVEYNPDGSQKSMRSTIIFSEQDRLGLDGTFVLSISMSDGRKKVEYFQGKLTTDRYWNEELKPVPSENGTARLEYYVAKGNFTMETLNFVARIKTGLDNYHIVQKEYHLALENKF